VTKAFLSYTHTDKPFVEGLARDLVNAGIDTFLDLWEIGPGDSIIAKINEGIGESDFLLVVLSTASATSKWVSHELNNALMRELESKEITVVPLKIDKTKVPVLLADKKYVDFTGPYDDALNELVRALLGSSGFERTVVPVITYNPAQGPKRELKRENLVFPGPSDFVEGVYVPWGLSRVEIVVTAPKEVEEGLYSYFFEKYDKQSLELDHRVSVDELTGLEVPKWKIAVRDAEDTASRETRELLVKLIETHNQQIAEILSLHEMLGRFSKQSSTSENLITPKFDSAAFLEAIRGDEQIAEFLDGDQIVVFATEMATALGRAVGVDVEIEEFFGQAFPLIILTTYLKTKFPEEYLSYARHFAGIEKGRDPLSEIEKQMLLMLEFYVIASQSELREFWAEYKLEHLSPEETDILEQFFVEQGMAGAIHQYGSAVELIRMVSGSSFEGYQMSLMALQGNQDSGKERG